MLKEYPDVCTVKEVAQILKIGSNSAYKLINNGMIKSRRIGRIYRIPKICVIEYLQCACKNESE